MVKKHVCTIYPSKEPSISHLCNVVDYGNVYESNTIWLKCQLMPTTWGNNIIWSSIQKQHKIKGCVTSMSVTKMFEDTAVKLPVTTAQIKMSQVIFSRMHHVLQDLCRVSDVDKLLSDQFQLTLVYTPCHGQRQAFNQKPLLKTYACVMMHILFYSRFRSRTL